MKIDNLILYYRRNGFSLIQISILLTVASLVIVAVLPSTRTTLSANQASVTKMNAILTALRQYQATYGVLPCPADPQLAIGATGYGVAATNVGTSNNCVTGGIYADTTNHIALGMVPIYSLGFSYDYALDGYGRDITYAVDTNATGSSSGTTCWPSTTMHGAITVNDNNNIQSTPVILVSYGADGHGAWLPLQSTSGTATRLNTGSSDANEQANAQVNSSFVNNTTFTTFYNGPATSTYDDLIAYKNPQWNFNNMPLSYVSTYNTGNCTSNCTPYSGYSYCRKITIDYLPGSTLSNFPMLFSGTYSWLAQSPTGQVQNSNGWDIVFTSDAAGTTKINYERESYISSTGALNFWVQVPTISSSGSNYIYVSYGYASVASDQSNKTGTWDGNYVGVWHMDEASSTTTNADSTSNGITETKFAASAPASVAGKIGNADYFNGTISSSVYTAASSSTPDLTNSNMTLEMWVYPLTWGNQPSTTYSQRYISNAKDTSPGDGYQLTDYGSSTDGSGFVWAVNVGGAQYIVSTPDAGGYGANTWYHVVATFNYLPHTMGMYINGSPSSYGTAIGKPWGLGNNAGHLRFGVRVDNDGWANAYIDEVRLSRSVRSSDWINAEYNNEIAPDQATYGSSGFYSIGGPATR